MAWLQLVYPMLKVAVIASVVIGVVVLAAYYPVIGCATAGMMIIVAVVLSVVRLSGMISEEEEQ